MCHAFLSDARFYQLLFRIDQSLANEVQAGGCRFCGGVYKVTTEGEQLLSRAPARVDIRVLRKYPAYLKWSKKANAPSSGKVTTPMQPDGAEVRPEEALDRAVKQLRDALEVDVLDRVRKAEAAFLEQVVVDLLIAMGYGGGDAAMGQVTGRSGDGGIDGTIREDTLGLDEVYVQAKKYADGNTVGESDLRNFAGAIDAAGTTKGVFVTTSKFTRAAKRYVERSPKRIILIDGEELAHLMVEHNVGVRRKSNYEIKRLDEDYFDMENF